MDRSRAPRVNREAAQKVRCYADDNHFRHSEVGAMDARYIRLIIFKEVSIHPYAEGYLKGSCNCRLPKIRDGRNASGARFA
jgi:hypothetical protein